jgi:hemerythrin-like domain-containing protein
MNPIQALVDEHKLILEVITAAEREAEYIEKNHKAHSDCIAMMTDFFINFADGCHHGKEEKQLFPAIAKRGNVNQNKPLEKYNSEHMAGRAHVRAIREGMVKFDSGDAGALEIVLKNLKEYAKELRFHIHKEDFGLFPMAEKILSESDKRELEKAFDKVEREEIGEGVHEKYHALAMNLKKSYGL